MSHTEAVFSIIADGDNGFFIWMGTETAPKIRCLKYTMTLWGARVALRRIVRHSSRLDQIVEQVKIGSGTPSLSEARTDSGQESKKDQESQ